VWAEMSDSERRESDKEMLSKVLPLLQDVVLQRSSDKKDSKEAKEKVYA